MLSSIAASLRKPTDTMTWTQLAASAIFIVAVLMAWRQVTMFIMREI